MKNKKLFIISMLISFLVSFAIGSFYYLNKNAKQIIRKRLANEQIIATEKNIKINFFKNKIEIIDPYINNLEEIHFDKAIVSVSKKDILNLGLNSEYLPHDISVKIDTIKVPVSIIRRYIGLVGAQKSDNDFVKKYLNVADKIVGHAALNYSFVEKNDNNEIKSDINISILHLFDFGVKYHIANISEEIMKNLRGKTRQVNYKDNMKIVPKLFELTFVDNGLIAGIIKYTEDLHGKETVQRDKNKFIAIVNDKLRKVLGDENTDEVVSFINKPTGISIHISQDKNLTFEDIVKIGTDKQAEFFDITIKRLN